MPSMLTHRCRHTMHYPHWVRGMVPQTLLRTWHAQLCNVLTSRGHNPRRNNNTTHWWRTAPTMHCPWKNLHQHRWLRQTGANTRGIIHMGTQHPNIPPNHDKPEGENQPLSRRRTLIQRGTRRAGATIHHIACRHYHPSRMWQRGGGQGTQNHILPCVKIGPKMGENWVQNHTRPTPSGNAV